MSRSRRMGAELSVDGVVRERMFLLLLEGEGEEEGGRYQRLQVCV